MYRAKTTFIIGAGASLELGFPTSKELKDAIASAVDFRFDFSTLVKGDHDIHRAIKEIAKQSGDTDNSIANAYFHAGQHIARAMPQSISIDNFVDNQSSDTITTVAKLGIANSLITAERSCVTKFRLGQAYESTFDWKKFQSTWIHHFLQSLTEGVPSAKLDALFSNIRFIIFNYDRSLEYFISKWIENYYNIPDDVSHSLLDVVEFLHPYGQIGKLPWQNGAQPTQEFGSDDRHHLYQISQSLLTFSEQMDDNEHLSLLHQTVNDSEQLVFLGFAYHASNMALLKPNRSRDTLRAIATALGISDPDRDVVLEEIRDLCLTNNSRTKRGSFIVDNTTTCSELFQKYRKLLLS